MTYSTFSEISKNIPSLMQNGETRLLESLYSIKNSSSDSSLEPIISRLTQLILSKNKVLSPWTFLGYYRLGSTLTNQCARTPEATTKLLKDMCDLVEKYPASKNIISYGDVDSAPREVWSYLLKVLQEGGSFPDDLEPTDTDIFRSIEKTIKETHQLIKIVDPELKMLMGELQGLIIAGKPGIRASHKKQSFGGATCFFFRGGTVINSSSKLSKARMIERLIHEYAHAELFTISQNELLCLNSDEQTYPVLIRSDPRPMNGIIHSLYVVCRVADFQQRMLGHDNNTMSIETLAETKKILSEQIAYGSSSLKALRNHASLTPLGSQITGLCEDFLNSKSIKQHK